ncbi:MAG: xanthine dehydrogenase family protein subunit M [Pseudomonadota bacterium]
MKPFDYMQPARLRDACLAWEDHGDTARLLAGGTDLTVGLRHGHLSTDLVIDLKAVAELRAEIRQEDGTLRIAAGTTMRALQQYLEENALFPALRDAAAVVGSIQIRNRATLAGNICNASPAADTVPVLAALGAQVEIAGTGGTRIKPVVDFIEGNRQTDLARGELVSAVRLPLPRGPQGCAFDRITRRRGVDLATTNMCCVIDALGTTTMAFGAVSPRPLVVIDESGVLADAGAQTSDRAQAIIAMASRAAPISDVRANADYRAAMLCVMAERALSAAHARLQGERADA